MFSSRTEILLPLHAKHRRSAPALRNVVISALVCVFVVGCKSLHGIAHATFSGHFDLDARGMHGSLSHHAESTMVILLRGVFIIANAVILAIWCSQDKGWTSACDAAKERLSIVRAICSGRSVWRKVARMPMPCALNFVA